MMVRSVHLSSGISTDEEAHGGNLLRSLARAEASISPQVLHYSSARQCGIVGIFYSYTAEHCTRK